MRSARARLIRTLGTAVVAVATAIVLVALSVAAFLTPAWVAFEQDRAQADAWTGWPAAVVHQVTTDVLHDLVVGPPAFAQVGPDGRPVFSDRERGHLVDVRGVFGAAAAVAAAALAVVLLAALVTWRAGPGAAAAAWRGVRAGVRGLAVVVVALGLVAAVAFDTAFEVFHELFFPAGSFTFDPRTDRLVQLFPESFWSETTFALGIVLVTASAVAYRVATVRLARARARAERPAGERAVAGASSARLTPGASS